MSTATLEVRDPWTELNHRIEQLAARFEVHIGYTRSDPAYEQSLERLLEMALRDGKMVYNGEANSIVVEDETWENRVLCLSVDPGRSSKLGHFGSYGGREASLIIRNGPHPNNVWMLFKVKWPMVIKVSNALTKSGRLCRDDAYKLFVYMIPRGAHLAY